MRWWPGRFGLKLGRDNTRVFLAMFFTEGSFGVYQNLWPLYIAALGASPPQIGLVMGILGVARLLFLLPSGVLADRVPPRRLIVAGRTTAILGMLAVALAQEWWQLIPAVGILAAGTVAFPAISSVIADDAGDNQDRTRAFTLVYTVSPAAALLLTPALGGIIAESISLRAIFVAAAILNGLAVASFWMITERPVTPNDGPPASYRTTLEQRPIRLVCGLMLVTIFSLSLGLILVPNFLQDVHGVSLRQIGGLGSIAAAGSVVLGIAINRLRVLQRPLTALGVAVVAVTVALGILLFGQAIWLFALAYFFRGGYLVIWSVFYAAFSEVTPSRYRARAYALAELLGGAGVATAPFVAGWLYDIQPTAPIIMALLIVVPLLLGIGWVARSVVTSEREPALVKERA